MKNYKPLQSTESARQYARGSGVSGSSPSGVQGSGPAARAFLQSKCNFIAVLKQFLVMYEEI